MKAKPRTQLFTLRVWEEDVGNGRIEIRCTLKHTLTGETIHFRDWATFIAHIQATCIHKGSSTETNTF